MSDLLERFQSELFDDPATVNAILSNFPPPPPEPKQVPIRCDAVSVDLAIARAVRLAVEGIQSQIKLVN